MIDYVYIMMCTSNSIGVPFAIMLQLQYFFYFDLNFCLLIAHIFMF